jgi:hypothetical protein
LSKCAFGKPLLCATKANVLTPFLPNLHANNKKRTMAKNISGEQKKDMSFLDHLEELRWHLIRASVAIFAVSIVAFTFKQIVFDVIIFGPRNPDFLTYRFFCWLSGQFGGSLFCFDEMPF